MPMDWKYEANLSYYDIIMFHNVMNSHCDSYIYIPIALAKREEIGIKYRYLCIAQPKSIYGPDSHLVIVEIYRSEMGVPYATRIKRIHFDELSF